MVFREAYETQDVRRMCKHAERDHETKKLAVLIDRLNRQLAAQGKPITPGMLRPPASVLSSTGIARQAGRFNLVDN
jgi:hypothetical protein